MQGFAIKTSDLDRQFNIGKNTRVNRLAMIGLLPEQLHKDGKFYWLTQEQYELFCNFDSYIRATGGTKDYPNLYVNYTEASLESSDKHEDCGELTTVAIAILIDFLRKMILMDLRKIKFGTVIEQFK